MIASSLKWWLQDEAPGSWWLLIVFAVPVVTLAALFVWDARRRRR